MKTVLTKKELKHIKTAKTYKELGKIAKKSLKRFFKQYSFKNSPTCILEFCAPISTGGTGNRQKNIDILHKAITSINKLGHHIFDQVPYEEALGKMKRARAKKIKGEYDYKLLRDFYLPLFKSGLIRCFVFLPGWQSSTGAKWEYKKAKKLFIQALELKPNWEALLKKGEKNIFKLTKKI